MTGRGRLVWLDEAEQEFGKRQPTGGTTLFDAAFAKLSMVSKPKPEVRGMIGNRQRHFLTGLEQDCVMGVTGKTIVGKFLRILPQTGGRRIAPDGQITDSVSSPLRKNILIPFRGKSLP